MASFCHQLFSFHNYAIRFGEVIHSDRSVDVAKENLMS